MTMALSGSVVVGFNFGLGRPQAIATNEKGGAYSQKNTPFAAAPLEYESSRPSGAKLALTSDRTPG